MRLCLWWIERRLDINFKSKKIIFRYLDVMNIYRVGCVFCIIYEIV